MEVRIIIDDRIVAVVKRITNRPLLAVAAGLMTLVAGTGVVYAVAPLNTFSASTVISATAVNENFSILRTAVEDLENAPGPFDACTTSYGTGCSSGTRCTHDCPSGQHPIGGGCETFNVTAIIENYPSTASGTTIQNGMADELTSWTCVAEGGTVWPTVICCP